MLVKIKILIMKMMMTIISMLPPRPTIVF